MFHHSLQGNGSTDMGCKLFATQNVAFTKYLYILFHKIKTGKLPALVVDEAYRCSQQEKGLPADKDAFNYFLSRQRQVIERAFGILVQRFGIF
jgi:hypothetical protein